MAEIVCKSCESADCKHLQRDKIFGVNYCGGKLVTDDWRLMLASAEEHGQIVFLPVKAGDTVYQLRDKKHALGVGVHPRHISCVRVYGNDWIAEHQGDKPCAKKDLGKTWFLTLEEAEAALNAVRCN